MNVYNLFGILQPGCPARPARLSSPVYMIHFKSTHEVEEIAEKASSCAQRQVKPWISIVKLAQLIHTAKTLDFRPPIGNNAEKSCRSISKAKQAELVKNGQSKTTLETLRELIKDSEFVKKARTKVQDRFNSYRHRLRRPSQTRLEKLVIRQTGILKHVPTDARGPDQLTRAPLFSAHTLPTQLSKSEGSTTLHPSSPLDTPAKIKKAR